MSIISIDPILSCKEAIEFESRILADDEDKEWQAMNRAGEAIGDSLLRYEGIRTIPHRPRILVLVGKDIMAGTPCGSKKRFLKTIPTAKAVIWPYCPWDEVRPLCKRAYDEFIELVGKRVDEVENLKVFVKLKLNHSF